jgi:hypothetical protein
MRRSGVRFPKAALCLPWSGASSPSHTADSSPPHTADCELIQPSKQPIEQPRHHHSDSERPSNSKPSTRATASCDEAGVTWL